jgi:hypothetical protein
VRQQLPVPLPPAPPLLAPRLLAPRLPGALQVLSRRVTARA